MTSRIRRIVLPLVFAAAPLAAQGQAPQVTYLVPTGAATTLPFSPAVKVDHMLYLAGQLGTDSTLKLAAGGIEAETRAALTNIKRLLEANGSDMDHVVKCLVMLADIAEWGKMNAVYVTFFPNHRPARSAMGASGLALNGRVEIECMATVP
ncbi:MAG TPA: RidA family protein [Gemmatimonadales bacterium]|nr:RidA family protein [Gemmatimonadales bacterium]